MASYEQLLSYYNALGVEPGADEATVKKAYRRKALETHPDHHPDDPQAAAKFHAVNIAYDALTDQKLRAEFEAKLAARAAASARFKELDESKRKMREALELREKEAAAGKTKAAAQNVAGASYDSELARLRRQGREHVEVAAAEAQQRMQAKASDFSLRCTVKAKWEQDVNDAAGIDDMVDDDGSMIQVLSEEQIEAMFTPYGPVLAVLSRKARSACIVFARLDSVASACASPPKGFRVVELTHEHNPTSYTVGQKRPRPPPSAAPDEEPTEGHHASTALRAVPTLSLAEHEARVFAKLQAKLQLAS
jgi:hypothetical protein